MKKITTPIDHTMSQRRTATPADLQRLLDFLREQHYQTIGPRFRDNAIVYAPIATLEELPIGWTDEQAGGQYRLHKEAGRLSLPTRWDLTR